MVVLPVWGWRAVFFVGVLPAFLTIWIRRYVKEPQLWSERASRVRAAVSATLPRRPRRPHRRPDLHERLHAVCVVGFQPVVARLSLEPARGRGHRPDGIGDVLVHHRDASGHVVGYVTFGYISDAIGRKRTYVHYLSTAAALIALYTSTARRPRALLLGPFVAFFATGYFSGFGAVTAELYPTEIRATAQGFTYNLGRHRQRRGAVHRRHAGIDPGFDVALSTTSIAFPLAAVMWIWIPETRGRALA